MRVQRYNFFCQYSKENRKSYHYFDYDDQKVLEMYIRFD